MLFCNQKMNFFLWQSNHVVSSPRLSTSHSTEIHGPSSMSLLWGLWKGRISTSDTWEEGNRGHQPDSGRGHDMSRWRLAVHWVAQVLPMLPTPCFKPQQGVSTMATCCNYVWSSKATVALAAPKLSQNLWEAGHRHQYVSISMYQRPLGDSCAGEVVSHQATPYSYHQSLNENQLPCSFLYQKFAIKRRKLPNVCGVWFFFKSFNVRWNFISVKCHGKCSPSRSVGTLWWLKWSAPSLAGQLGTGKSQGVSCCLWASEAAGPILAYGIRTADSF